MRKEYMMQIRINIRLLKIIIVSFISVLLVLMSIRVFAQEATNCVEMEIDDGNNMQICDEKYKITVDGQEKEITIKAVYSKEYIQELIKSEKYIVPLDRVGFDQNNSPKTYLVSYVNKDGCIASSRVEYQGKPTGKSEICFCELDLDRNLADIEYNYSTTNPNRLGASDAFFDENSCDFYIPKTLQRPTAILTPQATPAETGTPTESPDVPGDISQCLIAPVPPQVAGKGFLFPLILTSKPADWSGVVVSQWFGKADGSLGYTQHTGIDLAYPQGVPVVAGMDGIVDAVFTGWTDGYGNLVVVKHNFNGRQYYSYHAHLHTISVNQGVSVKAGQQLGTVGTTGNSTGNHLHYEIRQCPTGNASRQNCTAVDPKPLVVFGQTAGVPDQPQPTPQYDQACLDKLKEQAQKPNENYTPGTKFECMFKFAADAVDNITPEAIYAIAKQESGSSSFNYFICPRTWDSWRWEGDRQQCENNPLETALASRNGFNPDPNIDVRGLTQFQATTFSGLVKRNTAEMDKCIEKLGGKTTFTQGSELYDDAIDSDLRPGYSRHVVSHIICATAIKLKQDSVVFKDRVKEAGTGFTYKFSDDSIYLSKADWNEIVTKNLTAKLNFYNGNTVVHTQTFNALDYVGHRYHGSCRKDIIMRGNESYYQAYCEPVNNYYQQAYNGKLFEGCTGTASPSTSPTQPDQPADNISAQYCSESCTDCKYFGVNKTIALRNNYSPNVVIVPDDITRHQITDPISNTTYIPYLTQETIDNMKQMFNDAKTKSVELALRTGYRSYDYQTKLFESYVNQEMAKKPGISREDAAKLAAEYSARPGTSEHQLGTTSDVTCANCEANPFGNSADNRMAYKYLEEHGYKYGFIVSYTQTNQSITGFTPEGWHVRYIGKELAQKYIDAYKAKNGQYSLDKFFDEKCEK